MTRFSLLLLCCATALPLTAGELVCLKTGFCLRAESHIQKEANLSFRVGSGSIDFPTAEVASIVADASPAESRKEAPRQPVATSDPRAILADAADAEGVDADFIRSVAHVESGLKQQAVSRKGAIGLMQLMPGTARDLAVNPAQASENALGGAKYLRALLLRYHYNSALALAAYNAGPGAVARFGGVPPYAETRNYVLKVTREYDRLRAERARAAESGSQHRPSPAPQHGAGSVARADGGK